MFKICEINHVTINNNTEISFSFELTPDNLHRVSFEHLMKKLQNDCDNWNLGLIDGNFMYVNYCIDCEITNGCISELIEIQNGKTYPTKDVEGVVYKIIKTLELFSN